MPADPGHNGLDLIALYRVTGSGIGARLDLVDTIAFDGGTGPRHTAHWRGSDTLDRLLVSSAHIPRAVTTDPGSVFTRSFRNVQPSRTPETRPIVRDD